MNSTTCSMLWVAVAVLASRLAVAAEEWRITNSHPVSGTWRISEITFFADKACSKQLAVVQGSAYASPLHRHEVPSSEPLSHNDTEDCWGKCGSSSSGLCDWCGRGNACCRAGFPLDPPECHYAMTRTSRDHHQCVRLLPAGRKMAEVRTHEAFDGNYQTTFDAHCERSACPPGSLVLGVSVARPAAVQCVLVVEPQPQRGREPHGRRVWLQRARRPAQICPGLCRSGQHLECGSDKACHQHDSTGVCTHYLSPMGACSRSSELRAGVDCTGCRAVPNIWEAVPMPVADAKQGGPPVPVLLMHKGQKFAVTAMRDSLPTRVLPKKLRGPPGSKPPPAGVGDCWVPCQGRGGFCSYCGTGRACCRRGFDEDPEECKRAVGHSADHHQCVRVAAEHEGTECLEHCDGKAGMCSWCGAGGACCKRGDGNDPAECRGAMGFLTHGKQHECVRVPVPHEGEDCWSPCGGKSGSCSFCGAGNACCKAGARVRLPHSEEAEDDLDAPECRFATGFVKTHHECVRLAHSEHNGSIAVGADGSPEVLTGPAPAVARGAARPGARASPSEQEVQVRYQDHDDAGARAGAKAKSLAEAGALHAPAAPVPWPPSRALPSWVLACALSALLGSALTAACLALLVGRRPSWPRSEPTRECPIPSQSSRARWPTLLRSASRDFGRGSAHRKGRTGECSDDKSKPF